MCAQTHQDKGPSINGWQKRLSLAISARANAINEDRQTSTSAGVLQGCHDFQFKGPYQHSLHACPDGFALSILRTIGKAIRDWADSKVENGEIINRYFLTKIQFYGTDILRFAFAAMRQVSVQHIVGQHMPALALQTFAAQKKHLSVCSGSVLGEPVGMLQEQGHLA